MKWKDKPEAKEKIRWGFLLFPKLINGEWRWLCFARWKSVEHGDGGGFMGPYWSDDEWID